MGITYKDGKSKISLKIENNTDEEIESSKIKINLLNLQNEVTKVLLGYTPAMDEHSETELSFIDDIDLSNTYDYEVIEQ